MLPFAVLVPSLPLEEPQQIAGPNFVLDWGKSQILLIPEKDRPEEMNHSLPVSREKLWPILAREHQKASPGFMSVALASSPDSQ